MIVAVLVVVRGGILTSGLQTGKQQTKNTQHAKIYTHVQPSRAMLKKEFMVGFNYLRHQIKRTKCASQEYAG